MDMANNEENKADKLNAENSNEQSHDSKQSQNMFEPGSEVQKQAPKILSSFLGLGSCSSGSCSTKKRRNSCSTGRCPSGSCSNTNTLLLLIIAAVMLFIAYTNKSKADTLDTLGAVQTAPTTVIESAAASAGYSRLN